jgi:hypothetical protein
MDSDLSNASFSMERQKIDHQIRLTYQIKSVCFYYRYCGLVSLWNIIKLDDWDCNLKAIQDAKNRFRQYSKAYTTQQTNSNLERLVTSPKSEKDGQCSRDLWTTNPRHDKTRIEQTKGGLLRGSYR